MSQQGLAIHETLEQTLTDQTIASDMLIAAKASIKGTATALSEAASPQVRVLLKRQLAPMNNFRIS